LHGAAHVFLPCDAQTVWVAAAACYKQRLITDREALVDIALRLNVLAVCAVFAFVGAVLIGAF
jgi:hypothetical protein